MYFEIQWGHLNKKKIKQKGKDEHEISEERGKKYFGS
jgi:hypothetical protein